MYRVYVIPGSHACRSALLMLDHKRVPYEVVEFVTLTHPFCARVHGFTSGGQTRSAGRRRTVAIRIGDRFGTVPGLAIGAERVSTNHGIARFLDARHPQPPLLPRDPVRRAAVEEAERWANDTLQMAARRVVTAGLGENPARIGRLTADGRMGYLLYRSGRLRQMLIPQIMRRAFAAGPVNAERLLVDLSSLLDRVDALIADGVIGAAEPNVADFMIAPSLALMLYAPAIQRAMVGRPALALVDRYLPEPTAGP